MCIGLDKQPLNYFYCKKLVKVRSQYVQIFHTGKLTIVAIDKYFSSLMHRFCTSQMNLKMLLFLMKHVISVCLQKKTDAMFLLRFHRNHVIQPTQLPSQVVSCGCIHHHLPSSIVFLLELSTYNLIQFFHLMSFQI